MRLRQARSESRSRWRGGQSTSRVTPRKQRSALSGSKIRWIVGSNGICPNYQADVTPKYKETSLCLVISCRTRENYCRSLWTVAAKYSITPDQIDPATASSPRLWGMIKGCERASGFAACRRFDCPRNADCRQNVLLVKRAASPRRATGCKCLSERVRDGSPSGSPGLGMRWRYDVLSAASNSHDRWIRHWKIPNLMA